MSTKNAIYEEMPTQAPLREQKLKLSIPTLQISSVIKTIPNPSVPNAPQKPKITISTHIKEHPVLDGKEQQNHNLPYNINLMGGDAMKKLRSPMAKKQNKGLLSLNTIMPQPNNSHVNTSETELSPGTQSRNFLMKSIFNNSHSPTPERDAFKKRGSFSKNVMSPIQQYFNDASPRGINLNNTSLYDLTKTPDLENQSHSFNNENGHSGSQRNHSFNSSNKGDNNYDFNLNNELLDNSSANNQNEDEPNNNNTVNNTLDNNVLNVLHIPNSLIRMDSNGSGYEGTNNLSRLSRGLSPVVENDQKDSVDNSTPTNMNEQIPNIYTNNITQMPKQNNLQYNPANSAQNLNLMYSQNYQTTNNNMSPNMINPNQISQQQIYNNLYNNTNPSNNFTQFSYNYNQNFLASGYPVYQQQAMYMKQAQNLTMNPNIISIQQMQNRMPQPQVNKPPQQKSANSSQKKRGNTSNLYKMDNNEIAKQCHNLAKDQVGCRFLQKKIEENTTFALSTIYPIILDHLLDTINDQFGNYLIQKFFDYLSEEELYQFLQMISPSFANIGINQYGTRVLQKIIDFLKPEDKNNRLYTTFCELLKPNIILFANDINGCHIIQKILITKDFDINIIISEIAKQIEIIANHKNGCCFLQKSTEKLNGQELEMVLDAINEKAKSLITDQYGNYVIQHVIKINGPKRNLELFNLIIDNLPFYSNQKFSSNVIEKFFIFEDLKNAIINRLLIPNIMKEMLYDSFGNYVVQKALMNANKEYQMKMLCLMAPLMEDLKSLNFGAKLYHKLTVQYPMLLSIMMTLNNNPTKETLENSNDI